MNFFRVSVVTISLLAVLLTFIVMVFHADRHISAASPVGAFSFIHDLVQSNIAGVPLIHEQTQWDFDPEIGKRRKIRYEEENGRHGELAIAKIGMGIGYGGLWGTSA